MRLIRALLHDGQTICKMVRRTDSLRSTFRYSLDVFSLRLMKVAGILPNNRVRQIALKGGISLTYRLNRGDVQSIREIWIDQCYTLPFRPNPGICIDLGANIGMTTLWFAKRYGFREVIAVEPSPANAEIARKNIEDNNINTELIEAAIGPFDGTVNFGEAEASNVGRVSSEGHPVRMLSMLTLLKSLPAAQTIDLMKVDIEGGEEPLFEGDLQWLNKVQHIIAEFHPDIIDYPKVIRAIQAAGFDYIPANAAHEGSMDSFKRKLDVINASVSP